MRHICHIIKDGSCQIHSQSIGVQDSLREVPLKDQAKCECIKKNINLLADIKTKAEKEVKDLESKIAERTAQAKQLTDEIDSLKKLDPVGECRKRVTALDVARKQGVKE